MTITEAFGRVPYVRALARPERERLLPYARVRTLGLGEGCWHEGQSAEDFAFVVRGRVKLVKIAESGRETILEIGNSGELLCGSVVLCHARHCCSSLAMERGTQVLLLPRRDVLDLVERSPAAARALLRELADRGLALFHRVEELVGGQVEQRIALLLLRLAESSSPARSDDRALQVPIRLTRQELAGLTGTTVETAIRVMSRLKKRNIVQSIGRGFTVRNRQALEALARPQPQGRSYGTT